MRRRSKFLPEYPKGESINIARLLKHRSGAKSDTGMPGDSRAAAGATTTRGQVLVRAAIEAVTGKPWHQALDEILPMSSKRSGLTYPGQTRVIKASGPANLYLSAVDAKRDFELAEGREAQLTLLQGLARLVMKRRS